MKALTLHQPWATLVAVGAKQVETRGWATRYRGPIAIHAGHRRPPLMHLPKLWSRGSTRDEQHHYNHRTWLVIDTITDPRYQGPQPTGKRIPKTAQTPTLFWPSEGPDGAGVWDPDTGEGGRTEHLSLGAFVATATLVDVLPTEAITWMPDDGIAGPGRWGVGDRCCAIEENQRPLGDFRPGRYVWLLADIERLPDPIPARGHQGLWTATDTLGAAA